MHTSIKGLLAASVLTGAISQASAQPTNPNNLPPPGWILDLAGQGLPTSSYTQYVANFTASQSLTTVTFAMRNDPGYFGLDNVSVINTTTSSGNLLSNSGFESDTVGSTAASWMYFSQDNVTYTGIVSDAAYAASSATGLVLGASTGTNFWFDGSTGGYDGFSTQLATTIGDNYSISFDLMYAVQPSSVGVATNFQQTCTNGSTDTNPVLCNGVDFLAYASSGQPSTAVPTDAPEPTSLAVIGASLIGLAAARRRSGIRR